MVSGSDSGRLKTSGPDNAGGLLVLRLCIIVITQLDQKCNLIS